MKKLVAIVAGVEFWQDVPEFEAKLDTELEAARKQDREWSPVLVDVRKQDIQDKVDELLADLNHDPDRNYTREQVEQAVISVLEAKIEDVCDRLTDDIDDAKSKYYRVFWNRLDRGW